MKTDSKDVQSKALVTLSYPMAPKKNQNLRNNDQIVNLSTNLLKLEISKQEQKLCIYSISITPELARDNYSLFSKIQRQIDVELSKYFTRRCFSGNNLFASSPDPKEEINCEAFIENIKYMVKFSKVGQMDISEINDFEGENQRKKSFIEKVIKDILLKNKNTIKFGDDRTIVKVQERNIMNAEQQNGNRESIYKGFYTSAQITENGLFLLVTNVNKHISEITVYEVITQLKNDNQRKQESEIRKIIEDYLSTHRTVLTIYGALRTYRIKSIDFDATPEKTCFNIKDGDQVKTISILDYFKKQYKVDIKHPDQPLLIAERKSRNKKSDKNNNNSNGNQNTNQNQNNNQEEQIIYLVPELLYITGPNDLNNNKDRRRSVISKTKMDPNKRMFEINKIHDMINNSTEPKNFRGKDGNSYQGKTPAQVSKDWGINLGDNLVIQGRVLPQPKLLYANKNIVRPNNGVFRSGNIYNGISLNPNNFVYVYDRRDNSDIRNSLKGLFDKGRMKGLNIQFNRELNQNEIHGIALDNLNSWDNIKNSMRQIEQHKNEIDLAVVFLSQYLEKYYSNLKDYFTNELNIATQFVVSKKLQDQRRAGSILFNVVEQINIKMGGINFYIDFYGDNILVKNKVYLILGLESRQLNGEINYSMTSTTNPNLYKMITTIRKCKNIKEEKEKIIAELMQSALKGLRDSKAPHPPDYIILYRQGGNYVQNRKIADAEVPMFLKFLNEMKENVESFKKYNPKFIYVCCNLKGNLKFFERNNGNNANPKSGLCVDSSVTQKDKYEFYIQPQFVNQGTATPCHYQVLYEEVDSNDTESGLKMEQLQLLSFYLSFYYWTWAGAIRVPGALKLATTAMDFFSKHLYHRLNLPDQKFINPIYI